VDGVRAVRARFTGFMGVTMRRDATLVVMFGLAYCAMLTGCSAMTPGRMAAVRPYSDAPRAGNVYLLRGWIGIFSTGIDRLGEKVNASGVKGEVFQDDQWRALAETIAEKYAGVAEAEPLVLVGHSYGADDVVGIARVLDEKNIPVDLLVTLDPTTPPAVPKNVKRAYNLYQPNTLDALPFLRGIPLKAEEDFKGKLENVNIRKDRTDLLDDDVNHFNIEKKDKIHAETIRQILATCPPRGQWVVAHRVTSPARVTVVQTAAGSSGKAVGVKAGGAATQPTAARAGAGAGNMLSATK
jgi:hypothetical protein